MPTLSPPGRAIKRIPVVYPPTVAKKSDLNQPTPRDDDLRPCDLRAGEIPRVFAPPFCRPLAIAKQVLPRIGFREQITPTATAFASFHSALPP
jgi:hypothetical protein